MPDHDIALDEHLDYKLDPLRHLMNDHELEGIISVEGLSRASSSRSELLDVLPQQSHSIRDGILKLSFLNDPNNPLSISLAVDASPGCGGLAWPAGQVRCLLSCVELVQNELIRTLVVDPSQLSSSERHRLRQEQKYS